MKPEDNPNATDAHAILKNRGPRIER